jgi:AraC-like DNA-binding protein
MDRALPYSLDIDLTNHVGNLQRVHLLGVFGLYAQHESVGTVGASVQVLDRGEIHFCQELSNGRQYFEATTLKSVDRINGDGTCVSTVGTVEMPQGLARVDILSIDLPEDMPARRLRFKDLGTPASFILFDCFLELKPAPGCPFHSKQGGVALSEIPSIVRVGDRVRFASALAQVEKSVLTADSLDEARGQVLMFLALVSSATLEMGGSRSMHTIQLEAARELDKIHSLAEIGEVAKRRAEEISQGVFKDAQSPSSYLVDRALAIVQRNFARELSDASVAGQLGLSTSHFRYLFKEATGQPFHKYVVALRLEKAKQMLVEQDIAVSEVARAVGFGGLSHFSRAFAQRFSVSPTHIRRGVV